MNFKKCSIIRIVGNKGEKYRNSPAEFLRKMLELLTLFFQVRSIYDVIS